MTTGRRRWGEQPRPAGRPALDGRTKARIFALHVEHPSWGVRRVAAELLAETGVKVSRETVRKMWWAALSIPGPRSHRGRSR